MCADVEQWDGKQNICMVPLIVAPQTAKCRYDLDKAYLLIKIYIQTAA